MNKKLIWTSRSKNRIRPYIAFISIEPEPKDKIGVLLRETLNQPFSSQENLSRGTQKKKQCNKSEITKEGELTDARSPEAWTAE